MKTQQSESKTRKHIRRYMLRQSRIVHVCHALNKSYSLKEWIRDTNLNDDNSTSRVIATTNGYEFNINDVCLNPKIPFEWHDGNIHICVELCQLGNERWNYGYSYWFLDGGGAVGATYTRDDNKSYATEKEAINKCLDVFFREIQWNREKIEKFSVEYDDDGNKINTSSRKKAILNKIEKKLTEYRTKINSQQLSLFEL